MRRVLTLLIILGLVGLGVFWLLTAPQTLAQTDLPAHTPDVANGDYLFRAGGCASCHSAPPSADCADPKSSDKTQLGGGRCLKTPFGTFVVPNISPDAETGIGNWSDLEFVNAMQRGVGRDGEHLYPAFPYTSYQRMSISDVLDIKAYIDTLPPVSNVAASHDLALPFRLRRGLGLWKQLFLDGRTFSPIAGASVEINRGAYLVNGPGHCGECHTPRNVFGGMDRSRWLAGGPAPEGDGRIPNITPHKDGIGDWSAGDIVSSLKTGFLPSYDSFGGSMVAVQQNMATLSEADLAAMAAYLKSIPAIPDVK